MHSINMNDTVKYKITDEGIAHLKRKHDAFNNQYKTSKSILGEFTPPVADEDGWIKTQLWCLMSDFGDAIAMGAPSLIGNNLIIIGAKIIKK